MKNIEARVMVLKYDTWSECALQMYEVPLNYFSLLQMIMREITPKISKGELWFLCMTHCLIVFLKCMKFQPNSFNSVQLKEWTKKLHLVMLQGD